MNVLKITSSTDAVKTGTMRIIAVRLVAGSDAASALLYDASTATGDEFCKLSAPDANAVDKQWFGRNGFPIDTALSVTLSGTNSVLYVYYE